MRVSDKIELMFLGFLGDTGIIDIKKLILENKLGLSPEMNYEFSLYGMGTILLNVMKRIVEIMPEKTESVIIEGAKEAGKDFALLSKGWGLADKIDKIIPLLMDSYRMEYVQKKMAKNESVYSVAESGLFKILSEEGFPEVCRMLYEGWFEGIADTIAKGSSVKISKKMGEKGDHFEFVIGKKEAYEKELPSERKLKLHTDLAHDLAVREIGRTLTKIGKRVVEATTPKTYKSILFWGARDAGKEIAKMMQRLGIKDGLMGVEAGTVLFSTSARMKRVQIKISEEENIGHVFYCPWSSIAKKNDSPETCMICEGFCQGVADVMAEGSAAEIPMKMTHGDEFCKFVYRKVK